MATQVKLLKSLSLIVVAALVITLAAPLSVIAAEEVITLTTIMPSQDTSRVKRGAVGLTYKETSVLSDAQIGDNNLLIEGHVGIGTTESGNALTVNKTSPSANEKLFVVKKNDLQTVFSVDEDGDVVAGGTFLGQAFYIGEAPQRGLTSASLVFGDVDSTISLLPSSTGNGKGLTITAGGSGGGMGPQPGGDIFINGGDAFLTGADGDVILANARGNVGIGTTSPNYKLDVAGSINSSVGVCTGDITFRKGGEKLWRMFEDENGLYLESLKTGKVYSFVLQEID